MQRYLVILPSLRVYIEFSRTREPRRRVIHTSHPKLHLAELSLAIPAIEEAQRNEWLVAARDIFPFPHLLPLPIERNVTGQDNASGAL